MSTDFGKQIFDFGTALVRAQAEMLQRTGSTPRPIVYLLFHKEVVLGVCGTKARADQEAEEIGHAINAVIHIEPREVHS